MTIPANALRPINDPNLPPGTTPPVDPTAPPVVPPAPGNVTPPPAVPPVPPVPPEVDPLHVQPAEALTIDINGRITNARKQERDKLYSQIGRANEARDAALKAAETAATTLERITKENAALRAGTPPGNTPPPANAPTVPQGLTSEQLDRAIAAAIGKVTEAYEPQITALRAELETRDLGAYRNSLIEANKDSIIAELVQGKSKDEIDNSLTLAKQTFASVAARFKPTGTPPPAPTVPVSAAPPVAVPPVPSVNPGQSGTPTVPGQVSMTNVGRMSPQDYAKNRTAILAEASAAARKALADNPV